MLPLQVKQWMSQQTDDIGKPPLQSKKKRSPRVSCLQNVPVYAQSVRGPERRKYLFKRNLRQIQKPRRVIQWQDVPILAQSIRGLERIKKLFEQQFRRLDHGAARLTKTYAR